MQNLLQTSLSMLVTQLRIYFNNFDIIETSIILQYVSLFGKYLLSSVMNKLITLILGN